MNPAPVVENNDGLVASLLLDAEGSGDLIDLDIARLNLDSKLAAVADASAVPPVPPSVLALSPLELFTKVYGLIEHGNSLSEITKAFDDDEIATTDLSAKQKVHLLRRAQQRADHQLTLYLRDKFRNYKVYLGIQCDPFERSEYDLVIYQEALNTTGDMYHLLGFLALSHELGYTVPKMVLAYEENSSNTTSTPYRRTMGFLTALGLAEVDGSIENKLPMPHRPSTNSRRQAVRDSIADAKKTGCHMLDQKVTTQIIADQCYHAGREQTTEKIRSQLKGRLDAFLSRLPAHVKAHLVEVNKFVKTSNLVVLHRRLTYAKAGLNKPQDLTDEEAAAIVKLLKDKLYNVVTVLSSDLVNTCGAKRYLYQPFNKSHRVAVKHFPSPLPPWAVYLEEGGEVDMGKILHLALFINMYEVQDGPVKVIGNTSGTTDIIGMLGHDVLNVHTFTERLNYLAYRIVMQSSFLTICSRSAVDTTVDDTISNWCESSGDIPKIPVDPPASFSAMANKESGLVLHRDFVSLCAVETLPPGSTGDGEFELLYSTDEVFSRVASTYGWKK